jgi:hypothetical protein
MATWIIIGLLVAILVAIFLVGIDLWTGNLTCAVGNGFKEQQRELMNFSKGMINDHGIIGTKLERIESDLVRLRDELRDLSGIVNRKLT